MLVFQVTPWDKYAEIKQRREQEEFHCGISYDLLEKGYYKKAKMEFERALTINPNNYKALNGHYLCNLFLDLPFPDWDSAIGLEFQTHLNELGIIKEERLEHIVEKYLGDLHYKIGELESAVAHYENALELKKDYIDALDEYGWFNYFELHNSKEMLKCFNEMINSDPYDYRGYHGSGYALYMNALSTDDSDKCRELLQRATILCEKASNLKFYSIPVIMDFGEISRLFKPNLALDYHRRALLIISDEKLKDLEQNKGTFGINLLSILPGQTIYLDNLNYKKAWINYQIVLDYYAMYINGLIGIDKYRENTEELYRTAKELDRVGLAHYIYSDQKQVIDLIIDRLTND
jgi:tetratricopeptide (TPR) repeat protein